MKHVIFLSLTFGVLFLFSCEKEKNTPVTPELSGVYIGKTNSDSQSLQEVFTSPTMSHYEWVYNTNSIDPDTLIVTKLSADSFELSGNAAKFFPAEWRTFAFQESKGPAIFTYERTMSLSGYFNRHLQVTFDPSQKTLQTTYDSETFTPASNTEVRFTGSK